MVQKLYEKHKYEPPIPRNAPPVAGNIMWARQLLRRIETPMQRFAQNKALMATKESKKIIKLYNKVAKALIEFETLWHQVRGGCTAAHKCAHTVGAVGAGDNVLQSTGYGSWHDQRMWWGAKVERMWLRQGERKSSSGVMSLGTLNSQQCDHTACGCAAVTHTVPWLHVTRAGVAPLH